MILTTINVSKELSKTHKYAASYGVTNVRFFLNPPYLNGRYWHGAAFKPRLAVAPTPLN